ncbi:hypothetical protein REL05_014785 [Clostridioides difficile]|nr:hypothetical protein [Clostridioides difficile]MCI4282026.1 hypothetical protein [Clostridioides difficile]MCP3358849.1 hypothetical protein [Clostridioides difficile]MDS6199992.1 hypothetical protein [Clostridioides difficile]HBF8218535.1 hypothetical protein [Clostridioides difficile]
MENDKKADDYETYLSEKEVIRIELIFERTIPLCPKSRVELRKGGFLCQR